MISDVTNFLIDGLNRIEQNNYQKKKIVQFGFEQILIHFIPFGLNGIKIGLIRLRFERINASSIRFRF